MAAGLELDYKMAQTAGEVAATFGHLISEPKTDIALNLQLNSTGYVVSGLKGVTKHNPVARNMATLFSHSTEYDTKL